MSVRTSVLQFGYLLGAAIGGLMLPVWGFAGMGWSFAALFAVSGAMHLRKTPETTGEASVHLRR